MHDGLGNYFHLGSHWCSAFLALASMISYAQSDAQVVHLTDSQYVGIIDAVRASRDVLEEIEDNTETTYSVLYDVLDELQDNGTDIHNIRQEFHALFDHLSFTANNPNEDALNVFDQQVHTELIDIEDRLREHFSRDRLYQREMTNLVADIKYDTHYIFDRIDTLTTFVTNLTFETFPKNLAAALIMRDYEDTQEEQYLRQLYWLIYGDDADEDGFYDFYDSYTAGNGYYQSLDWLSRLAYIDDFSDAIDKVGIHNESTLGDLYYQLVYGDGFDSYAPQVGQMNYMLYGTHDLTQYTSNIVDYVSLLTNSVDVVESEDQYGDPILSLSGDAIHNIRGLTGGFTSTFNMQSNVAEVVVSNIGPIANSSYKSEMDRITSGTVLEDILETLTSGIESKLMESSSSLIPNASESSFTLDFGSVALFGNKETQLSFTLQKAPPTYFQIISVVSNCLKVVAALVCMYAIYHRVSEVV